MAVSNTTRGASGTRSGARSRIPADALPIQLSCVAGLPNLDGDGATAVRRFAESAFPVYASVPWTPVSYRTPVAYEEFTPVFYMHDGSEFRVASPRELLVQAQHLISRSFHRKGRLIDQPHVVRALLQVQLAAHPRAVFALVLLTR